MQGQEAAISTLAQLVDFLCKILTYRRAIYSVMFVFERKASEPSISFLFFFKQNSLIWLLHFSSKSNYILSILLSVSFLVTTLWLFYGYWREPSWVCNSWFILYSFIFHSYFIFEMVGGKTGDALSETTTLVLSTQCCWLHWESERSVESEAGKNTVY